MAQNEIELFWYRYSLSIEFCGYDVFSNFMSLKSTLQQMKRTGEKRLELPSYITAKGLPATNLDLDASSSGLSTSMIGTGQGLCLKLNKLIYRASFVAVII